MGKDSGVAMKPLPLHMYNHIYTTLTFNSKASRCTREMIVNFLSSGICLFFCEKEKEKFIVVNLWGSGVC